MADHHEEEALGKAIEPRLLRRLFGLAKPYRAYASGSLAVLLLESLAQLAGPLLTAAAIDLVLTRERTGAGSAARGVDGFFRAFGIDLAGGHGIEWIAGLSVAMALLAFVLMMVMVWWTSTMGQGVMYDLRTRIFGHLQRADVAVFDRTPVGRLMTRLTTDVDALNELFTSGFVALLGDVVVLAGIVGILFTLNPALAGITFGILLPMLWVTNWFRKGARDTYRDVRVKIARVNAFLQEHISGIAIVQLFRRERVAAKAFAEVNDAHREANIRSIFY